MDSRNNALFLSSRAVCHTTLLSSRADEIGVAIHNPQKWILGKPQMQASRQRILGFLMRNVGCKDNRKGVTLAVMTAAIVRRSRIYRKKPNPPAKIQHQTKKEQ